MPLSLVRRARLFTDGGRQRHSKRCYLSGDSDMLDITKDIQSLTTFRRNSAEVMKRLKSGKRAVILTAKGKAAAVIQDAESYRRLLDIAARADAAEGIRQGLQEARQGKGWPANEFFAAFESKHGIRG